MMFELSIDIEKELTRLFGSYEIIIPTSVQRELEILSKKGTGRRAQYATAALKLIKRYSIFSNNDNRVDDSILSLAQQIDASVLTNDKTLRHRLKQKNVNVIYLRGKQTLQMDSL
jgi:rRNA-processing protein FCF1